MNQKEKIDDKWIGYYFIPFAAIFAYYIGDDYPLYKSSFKTNDLIYIVLNVVSGLIVWKIIKKTIFDLIKEKITLPLFFKAFLLNLFLSLFFLIITRFLHDIFVAKIQTSPEFYTLDLPTDTLFIFIINLIYLILFYKRKIEQISYLKITKFENEKIILRGDNKLDVLQIELTELVCISSANNYVEVNYLKDSILKKKLLRTTLKNIHSDISSLLKVHRSYIINPMHFKDWKDSNTIHLTQMEVPVSKNYKKDLIAMSHSPKKTISSPLN